MSVKEVQEVIRKEFLSRMNIHHQTGLHMYWFTHNTILIAYELGERGLTCHSAHSDSVNHLEYMTPCLLR